MASATLATGRLLSPSAELGLPYNVELSDVADSCFLGVGILLESFLPVIQPGRAPIYKTGHFGVYNPKADRVTMSAAEKFREDKILLLEVLPDFYLLERARDTIPGLDEVTLGMMEYMRGREVSPWLCFAAQLMLDAHHATRHMRMGPFADLRMTGLRIGRTIDDYHELARTHPQPQFWSLEGEELIKHIRGNISHFIEKDALFDLKSALVVQFKHADKPVDHLLFTRNPVLCGLFAFRLNLLMQTVGQALVSQWFDVQQLAFLLNLARNTPSYGNLEWSDMELFIKIHGADHIFMGSLPTNAAQSLKRLEIVTGISKASRFASDSRSAQSEWHKPDGADGRRLTPTTKTAKLLREYYGFEAGKPPPRHSIDGTQLSTYLNELFGESAPKGARKYGNDKCNKKQVELIKADPQKLLGQKWRNKHNLGFTQLLMLLKSKLFEEEPHLLFNYFGMHKRSMELLRLIKRKEHHKFVQYFSEKYMPDDSMIQNLVILIHHVAQGSAREAQQMGLVKADQQMTSRIVVSCAEVMKAYLEKNGEVAIKELRTFCKNKGPLLESRSKKRPENGDDEARKESEMYWFCLGEVLGPAQMASLNTGIPM